MEHIILFAICTLIMRLSLPLPIYDHDSKMQSEPFLDAAITASISAAMAVPLWVALEFILLGMNALLN